MTTFADLKLGDKFRWCSLLGAGDLLQKTGDATYRNVTTGGPSRPLTDSIFTAADPVKMQTPYLAAKESGKASSFYSPDGVCKIEEFEHGPRFLHSPAFKYPITLP